MLKEKIQLVLVSWMLYGGSIFLYTYVPFYEKFLQSEPHHFLIQKTLLCLLGLYTIFVLLFKKKFLLEKERSYITILGLKKLLQFLLRAMQKELLLSSEEKVSLLLFLVKFYFIPIMSSFALNNFLDVFHYGKLFPSDINQNNLFSFYYPLVLSLIFLIDTTYFFVGYLIESASFNNIVFSVESTTLGWLVTLACYPPFNNLTNDIFGWYPQNFSNFGNNSLNIFFGGIALLLMSVYLWATLSLGSKASNLTNRGIITTGAYQFVRHPAYAAKNITWWIMGIPFIFSPQILLSSSDSTFIYFIMNDLPKTFVPILSLFAWSSIYYLRAVTEERHLLKDPQYQLYMNKVPYRFIPKVF